MSVALPKWYTEGRFYPDGRPKLAAINYILEVEEKTERAVIRFPGGPKSIKWDSDCNYCKGEMNSDFYPAHENNNPRCGGNGGSHCTCDSCF